jgi:hypothetical protein
MMPKVLPATAATCGGRKDRTMKPVKQGQNNSESSTSNRPMQARISSEFVQDSRATQKPSLLTVAVRGVLARNLLWRAFRGFEYENGVCVFVNTVIVFSNGAARKLEGHTWLELDSETAERALLELHRMRSHREANDAEYRLLELDFGTRQVLNPHPLEFGGLGLIA